MSPGIPAESRNPRASPFTPRLCATPVFRMAMLRGSDLPRWFLIGKEPPCWTSSTSFWSRLLRRRRYRRPPLRTHLGVRHGFRPRHRRSDLRPPPRSISATRWRGRSAFEGRRSWLPTSCIRRLRASPRPACLAARHLHGTALHQPSGPVLAPILGPLERGFYRAAGIDPKIAAALDALCAGLPRFQPRRLPAALRDPAAPIFSAAEPAGLRAGASPHLAFNTAVSFVTNTNWQSYGGETTMSYFSQMAGLTMQNFLSAATGIAVAVALIRGFCAARAAKTLGNFWVDLTRATLYVLLPLSIVVGAVPRLAGRAADPARPTSTATTLEGAEQTIAHGPVASQDAIKQLGTNGGGFFNANSAHPFENPTRARPTSSRCSAILLIPAAPSASPSAAWSATCRQGCGALGGDGHPARPRRAGLHLWGRDGRQSASRRACGVDQSPAIWKARRSASAPAIRRSGRPRPPPPPTAPSTPCMTASRRSAASSPMFRSSSARSSSAASARASTACCCSC